MTERRYQLNRKCLAATRILSRNRDSNSKYDYLYVDKDAVTCTNLATVLIRVTLPKQENAPSDPQVFTSDVLDIKAKGDELVTMPEGLEAKSNGKIVVPNFNSAIPNPSKQVANIALDAKTLIDVLKSACEVTDHARHLIRLRICGSGNNTLLRIDAHRDEDGQEFCAVLSNITYEGVNIPGDTNEVAAPTEMIDQQKLTLPVTEGRRFRD